MEENLYSRTAANVVNSPCIKLSVAAMDEIKEDLEHVRCGTRDNRYNVK